MAQRTVVTLTDDIDGSEATETVTFMLDGASYEIDLNEAHAEDVREVLSPYVAVARKAGGSAPARRSQSSAPKPRSGDDPDPKAVRAWAESKGIEVSPRGRLSSSVLEQYRADNA